jgi:signal peptidase I
MATTVGNEQKRSASALEDRAFTGGAISRSNMRTVRVALTVTTATILGLVLGSLLAALVTTEFFGFHVLTLQTDSMAPALRRGDVIAVRPLPISEVEAGDVVAFESGGDRIKIVHRVAGVIVTLMEFTDPETQEAKVSAIYRLQTRGDAAEMPDGNTVGASDLLGKVWFSVPLIGIGLGGVPLQTVLLAIAALTFVAWVAWELRMRSRPQKGRPESSGKP